jgi:diacylglycerol kinase
VTDAPQRTRTKSIADALRGIRQLLAEEPNARIHGLAATAVCALAAVLGVSRVEWAVLILTIACVFAAEAANTALEALADRVAPERHPLVAKAKDIAAAGVLLVALGSVGVGLLILGPPLLERLLPG